MRLVIVLYCMPRFDADFASAAARTPEPMEPCLFSYHVQGTSFVTCRIDQQAALGVGIADLIVAHLIT